ncbi:MAG: ABC transporter ATP-binding protein [Bacillales bacterium]|jgi:putative ABC transport system ATP-binding protein|nr:ABC transporter ATP-binding protein [Bacillales bacterium]
MSRVLIEFRKVRRTFKVGSTNINACNNLSFVINDGEFCLILGPSGSGKTTILNILGGMDSPDDGAVIVNEIDISHFSQKELTNYRRNDIGFVFQFYNLMPNLTALENVELASEVNTNKSLNPSDTLDKVGLKERKNNFPSQLSGGEQQRVAIARAIAKNPDILLCDEPTGALDFESGISVLKLLKDTCKTYHKTLIIVTHNQALKQIADHVITLHNGSVAHQEYIDEPLDIEDIVW